RRINIRDICGPPRYGSIVRYLRDLACEMRINLDRAARADPEIAKPRFEGFGIDVMPTGEGGNIDLVLPRLSRGSQALGCACEDPVPALCQLGADLAHIPQQHVWPPRRFQAWA